MIYRLLASAVLLLHLGFVLFVVAGGLLLLRWPRVAWLHVPAVVWGVILELRGLICPLTPLENRLRQQAGEAGYGGGFIEHYLVPAMYPQELTRELQIVLGGLALVLNVVVYGWVIRRRRRPAGEERRSG